MGLPLHETPCQLFGKSRLVGEVAQSKEKQYQRLLEPLFLASGGQGRLDGVARVLYKLQVGPLLWGQVLDCQALKLRYVYPEICTENGNHRRDGHDDRHQKGQHNCQYFFESFGV